MNLKLSTPQNEISPFSVRLTIFGVSAVTLIFKTDFFDPFNTPKFILLILLSSWLFGYLVRSYKITPLELKSLDTLILVVVLGFILSMVVSLFFTEPLITGFIGDVQRRNGFLSYLALSVILLYSSRIMNISNSLRIYRVAIVTGLILSCYGNLQISGNDFVNWNNPYNSMIATLGNPNFASAMLAVLLVIAFSGLLLKSLNYIYKVAILILIAGALFSIIQSNSRQGLLVVFFSISFYISVYIYLRNKKVGLVISSLSLLTSFLAILGMLQKGPLSQLLYKESVTVRGYYWSAGLEMLRNYPITGVGVDRYGTYFKEFREVGYPLKYGFDITSSNAHNTFIQLFATSGLFVGLCYLLLMILIFISGMRRILRVQPEQQFIILGLLSAWLGFQAQSLISIDNLGLSVWGWLLGGAILGLSRQRIDSQLNVKINEYSRMNKNKSADLNLVQPILSILILVPILVLSSFLYKSEVNLKLIQNYASPSAPQNKQFILEWSKDILNNSFTDPYYQYVNSLYLYDLGERDMAYTNLIKLLSNDSNNILYLKTLALFEEQKGNDMKAINALRSVAKGDPWNAENYLKLMELYKKIGDSNNAIVMKDKIQAIVPGSEIAKKAIEILG